MKLVLLLVLSCMVVQTMSWGVRFPRFRLPPIRFPPIPVPRLPSIPKLPNIPGLPIIGKRDVFPADDLDDQIEDAEISLDDLVRLVREMPEYDKTARSVDDDSMLDQGPQEHE